MAENFTTVIEAGELAGHLDDPRWCIVDARFDLADVRRGETDYAQGHIPGAVYAHLDRDLSGPPVTDRGRHPMPTPARMAEVFGGFGIDAATQVVAYDYGNGATAARLWWMLRFLGHEAVAVLDGGWAAWQADAARPVAGERPVRTPRVFESHPRPEWLVTVDEVSAAGLLVDAREARRYRGEVEPIDPVAGHIPGAVNHFFGDNLDDAGRWLAPAVLRERLARTLGTADSSAAVFYCGSGVTACHDLLALAHAGLAPGRLYGGSWSEWCADSERPVATGPEP